MSPFLICLNYFVDAPTVPLAVRHTRGDPWWSPMPFHERLLQRRCDGRCGAFSPNELSSSWRGLGFCDQRFFNRFCRNRLFTETFTFPLHTMYRHVAPGMLLTASAGNSSPRSKTLTKLKTNSDSASRSLRYKKLASTTRNA